MSLLECINLRTLECERITEMLMMRILIENNKQRFAE